MKITFKKLIFLFCLFGVLNNALAQVQLKQTVKHKLDKNAQVRGTDGMEYPYETWIKLYQTGKYGFKLIDAKNPDSPIFLMYELSEQEIEARMERAPKPMDSGAFKEGDDYNYFGFRDTEGKKFKVEDLKGKILVINYWFIKCMPCRQEIPQLNDLAAKFKDNPDVLFIAIGLDPYVDLKEFIKVIPFNYHLITDGKYYAEKHKITGYPTNIVVDRQGKVVFQSKGGSFANPSWMERSINASLAAQ